MNNSCREYTLPRSEPESRPRGWILGNTKIGPVLDVKVFFHQKRYGIEIMVESLFRDRTVSWVRIVNGINKYVTETSETISLERVEHRVTGKPVAKPQQKPLHWHATIRSQLLCSHKPWSDYCDTMHQFLEKMMEQYDLTILWKNLRQSSMALRNGQLMIGLFT